MNKINSVLKETLKEIIPSKETETYMSDEIKVFLEKINKRINKTKIKVEPFVGGSFAKKTLVKKGSYDVDLFLRFDKKYKEKDLTKLTKKLLKGIKKVSIVHGSRDYFQVNINPWFFIEVVPVIKVNNPKDSKNITDLSYSHVKYINKKIKSQKILDEIKLAKAFCSANETYGAESYVNGFSGYGIELLVYSYKSFEKFLKELSKKRKEKLIIDIEKDYKNSKEILFELNGSKLISPIILIDPTFKERNVLAALNEETFEKFKESAKAFLKRPSIGFFKKRQISLDELKENSKKEGNEFVLVLSKTKKQKGDIAGTKLLKFHKHLKKEIEKSFNVIDFGFKYGDKQEGKSYFIVKKKDYLLFSGPKEVDKNSVEKFKKEHNKTYLEKGRVFAKEKIEETIKSFMKKWTIKNKKKIKQMYVSKLKII
ncbi:hypothetical protein GW932_02450 [archaeon]|nr:hypothetical protein [archaeon]